MSKWEKIDPRDIKVGDRIKKTIGGTDAATFTIVSLPNAGYEWTPAVIKDAKGWAAAELPEERWLSPEGAAEFYRKVKTPKPVKSQSFEEVVRGTAEDLIHAQSWDDAIAASRRLLKWLAEA